MNILTVGGRHFEITNKHLTQEDIDYYCSNANNGLESYYNKPSLTKMHIFYEWSLWAKETGCTHFGLSPRNTSKQVMGLSCFYSDDEHDYLLTMSKVHNRAYVIR